VPRQSASSTASCPMTSFRPRLSLWQNRSPKVRLLSNEKSYVSVIDLDGDDGFTISGRLDDLIEMEVLENAENHEKALETSGNPDKIVAVGEKPEETPLNSDGQKGPANCLPVGKPVKKVFVVDVKTVKSFDYLDVPKLEHVLQLTFYLRVLREQYPGICGKLLYIKKEDFSFTEFDIPYSDENWRTLLRRISALHRTLTVPALKKHGAEPESKFVKSMKWGCAYCPHRDKCEFDCGPDGSGFKGMKLVSQPTEPVEAFL